MRKCILAILLSFIIVFTSGCIQQEDNYTIKLDKNGKVSIIETIGIKKTDINSVIKENELTREDFEQYGYNSLSDLLVDSLKITRKYDNVKITDFDNGTYIGFTQEIEEIPAKYFRGNQLMPGLVAYKDKPIIIENGFFKDKYTVRLKYNFQQGYIEIDKKNIEHQIKLKTSQDVQLSDMKYSFKNNKNGTFSVKSSGAIDDKKFKSAVITVPNPEITLTIKTPIKAKRQNATKVVNDLEYQWNLFSLEDTTDIYLEYEQMNGNIAALFIIICFALLLGLLGYFFFKQSSDVSL